eukprot:CAMPEP_0181296076 /NCGR_PEP_ID=MMETSP1101-20121128/4498_1 /TAXON_ID=46948 /ORGANISM="Rhodomonas abbreviata, Strain Caron Lab Isolate" /LENGTH=763 /DNA_ID=CAMNT_0023400891 /DNA_START=113 /DNA_END=2404 /DNA_ORIENTATION=+
MKKRVAGFCVFVFALVVCSVLVEHINLSTKRSLSREVPESRTLTRKGPQNVGFNTSSPQPEVKALPLKNATGLSFLNHEENGFVRVQPQELGLSQRILRIALHSVSKYYDGQEEGWINKSKSCAYSSTSIGCTFGRDSASAPDAVVVLAGWPGNSQAIKSLAQLRSLPATKRPKSFGIIIHEKEHFFRDSAFMARNLPLLNSLDFKVSYHKSADVPLGKNCKYFEAISEARGGHYGPRQTFLRKGGIAGFITNCGPVFRKTYIGELMQYLPIDQHGKCFGNMKTPKDMGRRAKGWMRKKTEVLKGYKFGLAFENDVQEGYVTEKVFNVLEAGAIPIYYGTPDVYDHVPRGSIIDVSSFPDPKALAEHIRMLQTNRTQFNSYFQWDATDMQELSERHACSSDWYCRVCEYLHSNSNTWGKLKSKTEISEHRFTQAVSSDRFLNSSHGNVMLERWNSPTCQSFLTNQSSCRARWQETSRPQILRNTGMRVLKPQTCSFEDLSRGGRDSEGTVKGHHPNLPNPMLDNRRVMTNEVAVSHEYKFVHVNVRKAGSSSSHRMISKLFKVEIFRDSSCPGHPTSLLNHGDRCSSLIVNKKMWADYFVFTFVRDPVDRFYSSAFQAHKNKIANADCATVQDFLKNLLQEMNRTHVVPNEHYESQAMSLSTPVLIDGVLGMLDYDWVGDIKSFSQSLPELVSRIEDNARRHLPSELKERVFRDENIPARKSGIEIRRCRTAVIDSMIREVYSHDNACFGTEATPSHLDRVRS